MRRLVGGILCSSPPPVRCSSDDTYVTAISCYSCMRRGGGVALLGSCHVMDCTTRGVEKFSFEHRTERFRLIA